MLTIAQRMSLRCFDISGRLFSRYAVVFPDGDTLVVNPAEDCVWVRKPGIDTDWLRDEVPFDDLPEPIKQVVESEYGVFYREPPSC